MHKINKLYLTLLHFHFHGLITQGSRGEGITKMCYLQTTWRETIWNTHECWFTNKTEPPFTHMGADFASPLYTRVAKDSDNTVKQYVC